MRWWLALVFAAIAALTALVVAELFTRRAEDAFRARATELASGSSVAAAREIADALETGDVRQTTDVLAAGRKLSLFVFEPAGRMVAIALHRPVRFGDSPLHREALERALAGRRYVESSDEGRTIVIGLPLRGGGEGALVSVAFRRDLVSEAGLIRDEIVQAALWAVLVAAVAGLLVATLIGRRLRRIASAAAAIEGGCFDTDLRPGMRDEVGELAATIDRMRDRLRASFEVLESERDRLRRLFEQLQEGVIAVDAQLRVVLINGRARALAGRLLKEAEPLAEPWPELSLRGLAAGLFKPDAAVAEARVSLDAETTLAIAGVPAGAGSRLALLVVGDVSARERRERAEREFVVNAAHELRTPITALGNAIEALESGAKDDPGDRDRFLAVIDRQTKRLGRLVRALLTLARAQTGQERLVLDSVRVAPVLAEVADGLETVEGVDVEVVCPENLSALAQFDLLVQVVGNLAANAAKHTERGRIVLAARRVDTSAVVIEVRDTGRGIERGEEERIFDRFYSGSGSGTGQREGFGLGLAIVRDAVRALGGVIDLESVPGRGTTARVTLAEARMVTR